MRDQTLILACKGGAIAADTREGGEILLGVSNAGTGATASLTAEQASRIGAFLNGAAAARRMRLEACAAEHGCWRHKQLYECLCNPGHGLHAGSCSNVNPLRACPVGAWCQAHGESVPSLVAAKHRIHAKHLPYNDGHLAIVLDEMRLCGAPTVHCVRWNGHLFALSSSHRLAAAHMLGLEPKLVIHAADSGPELDEFYRRILGRLPVYEFGHVHIMEVT